MKIKQVDPKKLVPYTNNARIHDDIQVSEIMGSIKEFGFVNPILARSDGTIIAGHGRHKASLALELDTVPVIHLDHLTEAQAKALVIADNKIAQSSTWDAQLLSIELESLNDDDFNMDLLGFRDNLSDWLKDDGEDPVGSEDDSSDPSSSSSPTESDEDLLGGTERLILIYETDTFYELSDIINNFKEVTGLSNTSEVFEHLLREWRSSNEDNRP